MTPFPRVRPPAITDDDQRPIWKSSYYPRRVSSMRTVTIGLMIAVVLAAFAIKFEMLRIFREAQTAIFQSDDMPPWMVRIITVVTIVALLPGFYLAWRNPSH